MEELWLMERALKFCHKKVPLLLNFAILVFPIDFTSNFYYFFFCKITPWAIQSLNRQQCNELLDFGHFMNQYY